MIEVERLRKTYGSHVAVKDLSFNISAGEIFGLLGANGAGKTTTLRLLTGLMRPDAGRVRIAGLDAVRQRAQMVRIIGVAFELPALYPRLTVEENLQLMGALRGVHVDEVADMLERWGLAKRRRQTVQTLSKGFKQRTMLARAFLGSPRAVFLDEPTSGLDPSSRDDIHHLLRDLQAEGATILLSTHDMTEAAQLCDRVAIMAEGRLLAIDPPAVLVGRLRDQALEVTWWNRGTLCETSLALADPATPETLFSLIRNGNIVQIRTTGSLDTVYRRLAGGDRA